MQTRLVCGLLMAVSVPVAYGDSITINSGAGVTFLDSGFTSMDFSSPFTAANFAAAQTGTPAFIITYTPYWIASLPAATGAKWVGTNSTAGANVGDTALYAISFDLPDTFLSASITLNYAVDNELGDTNPGIYLNGTALPGSTGIGSFTAEYTYTNSNVGSDLVQGTNWLYIDAVNGGAPAGLIFSANISTTDSANAAPEPASMLLFGAGLIAVGAAARRRK